MREEDLDEDEALEEAYEEALEEISQKRSKRAKRNAKNAKKKRAVQKELANKSLVKVLGFNSRKFDINLFIRNIESPKINIVRTIGTTGMYKLLIMSHDDYPFDIQFLDLQLFLAGRSLDDNVRAFG
jgi:hypothetical protein